MHQNSSDPSLPKSILTTRLSTGREQRNLGGLKARDQPVDGKLDVFHLLGMRHGFQWYAFLRLDQIPQEKIHPSLLTTNLPSKFIEALYYTHSRDDCRFISYFEDSNVPFGWQVGIDIRSGRAIEKQSPEYAIDKLLASFEIEGGYCVPMHNAKSERFVAVYLNGEPQRHARYPMLVLETLEAGQHENSITDSIFSLEPIELSCLKSMSKGLSSDEIAHQVGLSVFSVDTCINTALKKMGTNNRKTAISTAAYFNLL